MKSRLVFLLCCLLSLSVVAQTSSETTVHVNDKPDFSFIDFLISNNEFDDALLLLKSALYSKINNDVAYHDSLSYYLGTVYYNMKQLDSSVVYYEKVSPASGFYVKSKFFENFELIYTGKYNTAERKMNDFNPADSSLLELKRFQQGACALLQNDYGRFEQIGKDFNYSNFACAQEQKDLYKSRDELKANKKKSPLLAGLMSAVIPGTGKFYAGYQGQALSAMFPTLIFAATAAETYYRAGPKSFQFIAAAGLFSIFYVGNIWGSVLSVKTFYELRNNEIRNNIMLDLHIPIRRIFSN
jgi:hypothetical protein